MNLSANMLRSELPPVPSVHIIGEKQPRPEVVSFCHSLDLSRLFALQRLSESPPMGDGYNVIIGPLEIRTYLLTLAP